MAKSKDVVAKSSDAIGEINRKAHELTLCVEKMEVVCCRFIRRLIRRQELADQDKLQEAFTKELWEVLDDRRPADKIMQEAIELRIEIIHHLKVLDSIITELLQGKE